ncbi:fibronectin type III-like domain-contianing protein [Catenulispora yoronensis]
MAQLYVSDPSSTGEPPKQLKGFARVNLAPGQSQTVQFTVSSHDLAHWADSAGGWTTTSGPTRSSSATRPGTSR